VNTWKCLDKLYYMSGMYEECLDIREQAYEITKSHFDSIEEHTYNNGELDKFGCTIKWIDYADDDWLVNRWHEVEYGDNGREKEAKDYKIIMSYREEEFLCYYDNMNIYEYDTEGRIKRYMYECYKSDSDLLAERRTITYEYTEDGYKSHTVGVIIDLLGDEGDYNYEYDVDATVDQYGNATEGEYYNEYEYRSE